MKKIIFILFCSIPLFSFSQEKSKIIGETTIRRVSVGAEFYQDFWMNWPDQMNVRAINQGAGAFVTYNIPFGTSPLSFGIGAGLGFHNLFSNTTINDIKADTIVFTPIPDTISYKKSKLGLTYLDFPMELRFVAKNKVRFAVGVKLGYLLDAKTKFKGENLAGEEITAKYRKVNNIDKFRFGPTVRFGYDWFQIMGYFSVTQIFDKGLGPELYPISVGITFMPF
ncbi:MAG: PorT family protein [Bacteroidales bacterium]|jgi:hypothetical protein|nr:PorT family protein [Bacteroidales bacterium]